MAKPRKLELLHPALPLLVGLVIAQIIGTVQVYLSNLKLYTNLIIIEKAGYLAVPNQNVTPGLQEIAPAWWGGLFFTLSIGTGLALAATATAWIWDRLFNQNKHLRFFIILVWLGLLLLTNLRGINLWATLYCFLIPLIIFHTTVKLLPRRGRHRNNLRVLVHLLPILLLAILWLTQYDRQLFIDLRDHLLFSNPMGKKISDFYYKYTPYATEAFKSLNQKTLKTCRLPELSNQYQKEVLETALLAMDYLPVKTDATVDLEIVRKDNQFIFKHNGRVFVDTTAKVLLFDPRRILNQFSEATDKFAAFRQLTFLAFLLGYPLTLYILFHALFWLILQFFMDGQKAATIASGICIIISIFIFITFSFSRGSTIEKNKLADHLNANSWQERAAALRFIEAQKLPIERYKRYTEDLSALSVPERYWLVKAMARSNTTSTYETLILLLNDTHVNVESMAYWALARRGDLQAIPKILRAIKVSNRWYSQLYAYNALRTLGWKQSRLQ
jgi:hypothetical protein